MYKNIKPLLLLFLAALLADTPVFSQQAGPSGIPASSDEFVGPFASWLSVTGFGAAGDGVTDDTVAIQSALNTIATSASSPVLYFPNGTYKITATLTLTHTIGISLIGQNPTRTRIQWSGPVNGTMLLLNGVAYSKITRLNFDGKSSALIAIDQSYIGQGGYFDTGNEYSDDSFTNSGYGIRGGGHGYGFAETSVQRSHFIGNWVAGIAMMNFNALDLWVWYSTFQNCNMGVTNSIPNVGGAGNYHVYYSIFTASTVADLYLSNTGGFSARGNYSSGSAAFFSSPGATNNPANIDIVGNTVVLGSSGPVVTLLNQGPALLMDNLFISKAAPASWWWAWSRDSDAESIGNTFSLSNAVTVSGGKLIQIGDQVNASPGQSPAPPILPATLPTLNRVVYEIAPGASASAIQSTIDLAAGLNGRRPIVHIPYGTYNVNQTIVVPASDIQIVGDGYNVGGRGTTLNWSGAALGAGPVLQIEGPTRVTLRDIGINGGTKSNGILIRNVDQAGSRIYMDQAQLTNGCTESCLRVNGIDHSGVELQNIGIIGLALVTGGPLSSSGATTTGHVNIFSGAGGGSTSNTGFDVSQGGKLLVRDYWFDNGRTNAEFATVHGLANFTADGDMLYQSRAGTASIAVNDLKGTATILTSDLGWSTGVDVSGGGTDSNVLAMGIVMSHNPSQCFADASRPSAIAAMLNCRVQSTIPGNATAPTSNTGNANPAFITAMVAQARSQNPTVLSSLPLETSDVRFFRVAASGINAVVLQGAQVVNSTIPPSIHAGSAGLTLTVTGSWFTPSSRVQWNGTSRVTTYVSPTQLTAPITAADIATAGTAEITVVDPALGTSSAATFTIEHVRMHPVN